MASPAAAGVPSVSKWGVGSILLGEGSLVVAVSDVCGVAALLRVVARPRFATGGFGMTPEAERHCETEHVNYFVRPARKCTFDV